MTHGRLAVVTACVLGLLGVTVACLGDDQSTMFAERLSAIGRSAARGQDTIEKLEEQYLGLLPLAVSLAGKGQVYAGIADMYMGSGVRDARAGLAYAQIALMFPQPPETAVRMYAHWADALDALYADWTGPRHAAQRCFVAQPLLSGLLFALANGAPKDQPALPAVGRLSVMGPTPAQEKQYAEQVAARKQAERLDALWGYRSHAISLLAEMYLREPADPDELESLATTALADYPDVVKELVDKVDAELKRRQGAK